MKINDRFDLERDQWQWILKVKREGKKKDGSPKIAIDNKYFGSLDQVSRYMLNEYAVDCAELNALAAIFNSAADDITMSLKEAV